MKLIKVASAIDHLTPQQLRDPDYFKCHYFGLYINLGALREEMEKWETLDNITLITFIEEAEDILANGLDRPILITNDGDFTTRYMGYPYHDHKSYTGVYDIRRNPEKYAKLYDRLYERSIFFLHIINHDYPFKPFVLSTDY